jgi:hypothetical protein
MTPIASQSTENGTLEHSFQDAYLTNSLLNSTFCLIKQIFSDSYG